MPLESKLNEETFFGRLKKKLRKVILPVALLTSVASSYLPKKVEAQQTIDKNIEVTLDQRVQDKTEDYRRAFGFISDYYFTFQTPGRNYVFARHRQTGNFWYNLFVNGQAVMQPQEILNSGNSVSVVPLNQDNQPGDETVPMLLNGRWQSFPANSFFNYMNNQPLTNGIEFSPSIVSSMFKQQQQPSRVVSYNTDRGTQGFIFSSQGDAINDSNAFFLDSSGNRYDVSSAASSLVNVAKRIEPNFTLYNISYVNKGEGGKFVLAGTASRPLEDKLLNVYVKHYENDGPIQGAKIAVEDKQCLTDIVGTCQIKLPGTFSGVHDILILANGYATRGKEVLFNDNNTSLVERIVPIQLSGLSVEEEGKRKDTFPWELYDANARRDGGDLSQLFTTGIVTGGHSVKFKNYLPKSRFPNNPDAVRYIINTNNSLTTRTITPDMVTLSEDIIIEIIKLMSNGDVILSRNDIEKSSAPFQTLNQLPGVSYIFLWQDLNFFGTGVVGSSGYQTNGGSIVRSSSSIVPGAPRETYWHEGLIGVVSEQNGALGIRYGPDKSVFHGTYGNLQGPTPVDLKVIKLYSLRDAGHRTATKIIQGTSTFVQDYSPLNR